MIFMYHYTLLKKLAFPTEFSDGFFRRKLSDGFPTDFRRNQEESTKVNIDKNPSEIRHRNLEKNKTYILENVCDGFVAEINNIS